MKEDWRFRQSPYVQFGGLVAYAGVPLRLKDESGQSVSIGSLCVASRDSQEPLTKTQQSTLARLADWVVSDLVQCTKARRQRVRREMTDLLARAQRRIEETDMEEHVFELLRTMYPAADVALRPCKGGDVRIEGLDPIPVCDLEDGIWEDIDFLDNFIARSNHKELPTDRIVRVLTAQCESVTGASVLSIASRDYRHVFDDIDSWFLESCANILTSMWQKRLLNEAMEAKERFLRGFSHQLRTPLHVILGSVELLAEEIRTQSLRELSRTTPAFVRLAQTVDSDTPTVHLDTIKAAGRDLVNIVNSMILLNRWADIAAKERNYALHTIHDIERELASEINKVLSSDLRYHTTIFFHHDLRSERDSLQIDLALLRDCVLPLIVNGIQSTPEGTVTITITISPDTKELLVDVKDTGCGILEQDQERIFEPYERAHETETIGAGVGLSLASKFAALMHGSVSLVSSQRKRGSHFRASFKCVESSLSSSPMAQLASELDQLPRQFFHDPKDDVHLSVCGQFSQYLASQGFTAAKEPEGALRFFEHPADAELAAQLPGQVAVCLVHARHAETAPTDPEDRAVYVSSPFSTSKLRAVLKEVNSRLAAIQAKNAETSADESDVDSSTESHTPPTSGSEHEDDAQSPSIVEPKSAILNFVEDMPQSIQPTEKREPSAAVSTDGQAATLEDFENAPEEEARAPLPTGHVRPPSEKPVALLVDDNSVNLRIMQMYCNKRKISYFSAMDGQRAVEIFKERQCLHAAGKGDAISLILMDMQMPICDGIEATRQIRQIEQDEKLPPSTLFMVTGQDGPSDRTAADEAGADDYFVKPVSIKSLDAGVERRFPIFKS